MTAFHERSYALQNDIQFLHCYNADLRISDYDPQMDNSEMT
jgi:hypothetical protein